MTFRRREASLSFHYSVAIVGGSHFSLQSRGTLRTMGASNLSRLGAPTLREEGSRHCRLPRTGSYSTLYKLPRTSFIPYKPIKIKF
jgi:hypothetical protein